MTTVQIERRRRGIFGWVVALLFWGWHTLMIWWLIEGSRHATNLSTSLRTEAERIGADIGTGIGVTMLLFVWMLGTVILGAMMAFTRGRRELITVERP